MLLIAKRHLNVVIYNVCLKAVTLRNTSWFQKEHNVKLSKGDGHLIRL